MNKIPNKVVQAYNVLKSGKPVKFDDFVAQLNSKPGTAMVLICALRRDCGAEIDTIRVGRKAESYQLLNADKIAAKMAAAGSATSTKQAAKKKVVKKKAVKKAAVVAKKSKTIDLENDGVAVPDADMEFDELSDRELDDLKAQLGI